MLKGSFAKDGRQVYFGSEVVAGADSPSFSIVSFNDGAKNDTIFAKDRTHVFYYGGWDSTLSVIRGADPSTFVTLDQDSYYGGYARDASTVYFGATAVRGADVKSFQSMAPYGKDLRAVYLEGKRIDGADPATFVFLSATDGGGALGYAKDAHAVYYEWNRMPNADPATFVVDSDSDTVDARDKKHQYLGGQIVK